MPGSDEKKGKALRKVISRKEQSVYKPAHNRPSVLKMISESNFDRLPNLIPLRHYRMSISPFAFYRGTASIMARDLSDLPVTGVHVQAVGDCHMMNFGGFATPERTLVFDVNDFDETLPAPWEWDVKRLATSFVLAARRKGLSEAVAKEIAMVTMNSYRKNMAEFANMRLIHLWHMKFDVEVILDKTRDEGERQILDTALAKANKSTIKEAFYKTTQNVSGEFKIADHPPLVYHLPNMEQEKEMILKLLDGYRATLQNDRRWLFNKYAMIDAALKVVGVGSVGTRCYVILMMNERNEPFFLQVKEARKSVLEPYTSKSKYSHNGRRVVEGQRLVQAASDIFLGWSTDEDGRHFYLRQLEDKKVSPDVEQFDREVLSAYASLCGRMLARAHAKTGNAALLSAYLGRTEVFDEAVTAFAVAYADQTEKDYEDFMKAIRAGRLPINDVPPV